MGLTLKATSSWLPLLLIFCVVSDFDLYGLPPIQPSATGIYPLIKWDNLHGEKNYENNWTKMCAGDEDVTLDCPPFILTEELQSRVAVLWLRRRGSDLGLIGGFHPKTNKDIPPLTVTLTMDLELVTSDLIVYRMHQQKVVTIKHEGDINWYRLLTFFNVPWSRLSITRFLSPRALVTLRAANRSKPGTF
jgi:hypothetical protein